MATTVTGTVMLRMRTGAGREKVGADGGTAVDSVG